MIIRDEERGENQSVMSGQAPIKNYFENGHPGKNEEDVRGCL